MQKYSTHLDSEKSRKHNEKYSKYKKRAEQKVSEKITSLITKPTQKNGEQSCEKKPNSILYNTLKLTKERKNTNTNKNGIA